MIRGGYYVPSCFVGPAEVISSGLFSYMTGIIQVFGHCNATWYTMFRSLVKLTEIGTSWGDARQ